MSSRYIDYDIMLALLRIYARNSKLHIRNVVGNGFSLSDLEKELGDQRLTVEEREQAMQCARELRERRLIIPTHSDLANPEEWQIITDAGREALKREALDELDEALLKLSASHVETRRGAWRAVNSSAPDSLRQAAHSGRELVSQVLKEISPDEEIRAQSWFQPAEKSNNGITRKHRYKYALEKRASIYSETDVEISLKGEDFLEIQYIKLSAAAHSRTPIDQSSVRDALITVEIILRRMLI